MSYGTHIGLDPDKTGVTMNELRHREKLRQIRKKFRERGWIITRYYTYKGGERLEMRRKATPRKLYITVKEDYTYEESTRKPRL